jgi:hypothetical protein
MRNPPSAGGPRVDESDDGLGDRRLNTAPPDSAQQQLRYQRAVTRVHALGPRPVGELIRELTTEHNIDRETVLALLEQYAAGLSPEIVGAVGARDYPPPPLWLVK